jgi:hypothetical protein
VAGDFLAGGIGGDPFAPEGEVYDDCSKHRGLLALSGNYRARRRGISRVLKISLNLCSEVI